MKATINCAVVKKEYLNSNGKTFTSYELKTEESTIPYVYGVMEIFPSHVLNIDDILDKPCDHTFDIRCRYDKENGKWKTTMKILA